MADHGNFAFGGVQRSYSFPRFWADRIPTSTAGAQCPNMKCEQVFLKNHPDSSGNIIIGGSEVLSTGQGFTLAPGDATGWIPINSLDLVYHKEADATTYLEYMIIF